MYDLDRADLLGALSGIQTSLRSDGYDLTVAAAEMRITVAIGAGPGACADCLIPRDLMRQMIISELGHRGVQLGNRSVEIRYPTDLDRHE